MPVFFPLPGRLSGKVVHFLSRTLLLGAVLVSVVVAILWWFQEKLLFHPKVPRGYETPDKNPVGYQTPKQLGMEYEDVYFPTSDGVTIHAWLIKHDAYGSKPTLIFFQGNAGNMGFRIPHLFGIYKACQFNILAVSYRGYGYSSGIPSESGVYFDAEASVDFLLTRKDLDPAKIFVFGHSVGGAVAIELGKRRECHVRGVIVENTFTSLREMLAVIMPYIRFLWPIVKRVQRVTMDSLHKVAVSRTPLLVICGKQDLLVPPSQCQRLYEASGSTVKELHWVSDGAHDDTWFKGGETYFQCIKAFVDRVLHRQEEKTKSESSRERERIQHVVSDDADTAAASVPRRRLPAPRRSEPLEPEADCNLSDNL